MPIYEYKCQQCGHWFDAFQRVGDDGTNLECPNCGAAKPVKMLSAFSSGGKSDKSASCGTSGFG